MRRQEVMFFMLQNMVRLDMKPSAFHTLRNCLYPSRPFRASLALPVAIPNPAQILDTFYTVNSTKIAISLSITRSHNFDSALRNHLLNYGSLPKRHLLELLIELSLHAVLDGFEHIIHRHLLLVYAGL